MKIVLVSPYLSPDILYGEWDLSSVDSVSPPLGLLFLATIAKARGHDPVIIDAMALKLPPDTLGERVAAHRPALVGITAVTSSVLAAARSAEAIKKALPSATVIIGGPHVTARPIETLQMFHSFDMGVVGEGELSFVEMLDALGRGESMHGIQGLVIRDEPSCVCTPRRPFIPNLDILPPPAWELLPGLLSYYSPTIIGTRSKNRVAVVTSRGCPGGCTFCDTSVFGTRYRSHSPEYVVAMLKTLKENYAIEDLLFYDDNFTSDPPRLLRIFDLLKQANLSFTWSCSTGVKYVTPSLLKHMKENGCWQIEYGIESGNEGILKLMGKRISRDQVRQALRWTKEAGISTRGNFILGFPTETEETLRETVRFALSLDLDYFQQTFFTPFPGSPIHKVARKYGVFDDDLKKMNNLCINFIPFGLDKKILIRYSKIAFRRFYLRPKIILFHLRSIRSWTSLLFLVESFFAFMKTIFSRRGTSATTGHTDTRRQMT